MENKPDPNLEGAQTPPSTQEPHSVFVLVAPSVIESRRVELATLARATENIDPRIQGTLISFESQITLCVKLFTDPEDLLAAIETDPACAILIDNREPNPPTTFSDSVAGKVLPDVLARIGAGRASIRSSILVIIPEFEATAHHAYAVGSIQLGGVIVEPASLGIALESACRSVRLPEAGKVALCLAGGGIEGMFYELGVLRALDAHLIGRSITEFDIFSGISCGAIIGATLANGVHPTELADALKGRPSRMDPITRGMLFDPNFSEMATRISGALGDLLRGKWLRTPLDAALKVTPNAIFSGDRLRWFLEKQLSKPGMTNDFNQLEKSLFVGVTDQDTNTHVTFGEEGFRDIPISHALRASTAMTPYYPPEKIKGRYYIDGIFTRSNNLDVAVAHGARLVICVDPLAPVQVDEPGYVSNRGGFFNTVQSIKSMIHTRLSELIGRAEEAYPNVSVVVFSPTSRDLEQMSGTLMRFFYRIETEQMAFESASQQIDQDFAWLAADFDRHGFKLSRTPQM